ncbi:MAG: NADH-quinone oxidoreductase subunit J [Armatimonadetes bacterium]|nr:NADH-quinone oxidoreductase subunit J [Armatimonadota bacterium]
MTPGPAFWILAAAIVVSSLGVVLARNMVHSALCLAAALLFVGGLYLNLDADLFAGFQVLIYVGAVVTLMLIAIMLIQNIADRAVVQTNRRWGPGAVVAAATLALMSWVFAGSRFVESAQPVLYDTQMRQLCLALLDRYLLPFELASVLLLVALVGAILIAQQTEGKEGPR